MESQHHVGLFALQQRDEAPAAETPVGQHDLLGKSRYSFANRTFDYVVSQ
jgi:hypothetical protein